MSNSLTWLSEVLTNAGLKVAEVDGWKTRGRNDLGDIMGVMCHHTGVLAKGNMPTLTCLVEGRASPNPTPGPLANLGVGRDGTYYIIAAGRANHAGVGSWRGVRNGNASFIGIEVENTGGADDFPWPEVQIDAVYRGTAAMLRYLGRTADFCIGHKEYALPPRRKIDPNINMDDFRLRVSSILEGTTPVPTLIPAVEPATAAGEPGRPTLRRGMMGPLVELVQKKSGVPLVDGIFGPKTEAAVREFQRVHGLVPDGIVGPKTWKVLDSI